MEYPSAWLSFPRIIKGIREVLVNGRINFYDLGIRRGTHSCAWINKSITWEDDYFFDIYSGGLGFVIDSVSYTKLYTDLIRYLRDRNFNVLRLDQMPLTRN